MKKVLLITVRSDVGGGPQHVFDLLTYGAPEKVSFFVAAPDEAPFANNFKSLSKGFIEIPHQKFSLFAFYKILIFLKNHDISMIHSHGFGAGIYSRLLSLLGFKVIHTFHGVHKPKSLKGKVKNLFEKVLIHLTDMALFVSPSERENAIECGIPLLGKELVIFNGIPLPECSQSSRPSIKNIGIISRFDPHKNVSQAIRYFAELLKTSPNLKLNIGGDGEEKDKLIGLVNELSINSHVEFHGFIDNPLDFLKSQDIYLSTSFGEGLPYTVLEAMSVGAIPLLSRVSGHVDILPEPYLFDLNNLFEFKKKFIELTTIKDPPFRAILERDFDIKKQIEKVVEVY